MDPGTRKNFLIAQCRAMSLELTDRLGDANPYAESDFSTLDLESLAEAKRLMHELLYAPIRRGS